MFNKKGFTLIEILAVIVIIGIVSLITVPTVAKLIQKTGNHVFESNEKLLAAAAENYYKMNTFLLPVNISDMQAVSLDTLIQEGYTKQIKNPKDASIVCDGYAVIEKTDSKKYVYRGYLDCGEEMVTENYSDYLYLVPSIE